jgi:hypothetical protein
MSKACLFKDGNKINCGITLINSNATSAKVFTKSYMYEALTLILRG